MKHIIFSRTSIAVTLLFILAGLFSCNKKDSQSTGSTITISSVSVDTAWIGKTIKINGSGFSATASENTVRIGNTVVREVIEAAATTLTCKVPAGAFSAKAYVKVKEEEAASAKELIIVNQMAWQKALGGTGTDVANAVVPTSDGGYLVAGYTNSSNGDVTGYRGNNDYWVVKVKADQTIAWQKTLGGTGDDMAYDIVTSPDGGCVVAGYSYSTNGDVTGNHGGSDVWVVKLDAGGAIVWQKAMGGSANDVAYSIISNSGNYIIAGSAESNDGNVINNHGGADFWLVWFNETGSAIGTNTLGGTGIDRAYSIKATSDGGFLVAGTTYSSGGDVSVNHGSADYWVVKLNISSSIEWQKTLGGTLLDIGRSIITTSDGGCIVAGYTNSTDGDITGNHGGNDYWLVKLNAGGNIAWQKTLGGTGDDNLMALAPATDGGYAIAGYTTSTNGDVTGNHGGSSDAWVVRLNSNGGMVWQKALGGTSIDKGRSIMSTSNSGFIVAGCSGSADGDVSGVHGSLEDFWLFKILD